jgi:hypothetical protein
MASAQQLKEWAAEYMKQATVSVGTTTANSYRKLADRLHELSARRTARDAESARPRKDPSPSPDE